MASAEEVRGARVLSADGLLDGIAAAEYGPLVLVELTPKGRWLVENKLGGHEPTGGSPVSIGNIRIDGSGNIINIQHSSPGAMQHSQITPHTTSRMCAWADDVERNAPSHGLPDEDLAEVLDEITQLRAELARENPEPTTVRRIGRHVLRILGNAAEGVATTGLIEAGSQIFN